jgi:hypothetical protein
MASRVGYVLACGLAACALVSCFPQGACTSNPGFVDYCGPGDTTCQGVILDATHWQSGPINGAWLNFSREKTILMHFRDAQTGATLSGNLANVAISINVSASLSDSPNQAVPCSGNNCEYTPLGDGSGVYVRNDTCGDYFVYAYATIYPSADAGADASDASTE